VRMRFRRDGSGSCPVACSGISGVESLAYATAVLVVIIYV
jgi:hypothetical protein